MKKMLFFSITSVIIVIAGCNPPEPEVIVGNNHENTIVEVAQIGHSQLEVLAQDLIVPWSIDKVNDTFYISERSGTITKIEEGQAVRQQVELEMDLSQVDEAGLLGFILAPDFTTSNRAFAYYTYELNQGRFNRIVSLILENDIWKEEKILLDKIPGGNFHHGGRLKIGPDGKLYATAGDALQSPLAQNINSYAGKILRMNLDGSIPSDNPNPRSYVYSYGHRNPQGLTWTPEGTMYASEHGNSANDEINKIVSGRNYGWPEIEGLEKQDGMISPIFTSGDNNTWAPSGMDFYDGKLYVAALRGSAIIEFNLETNMQTEIITGLGRIRDVFIDGDDLYFITNNTDGRGKPQEKDDKLYKFSLSEVD